MSMIRLQDEALHSPSSTAVGSRPLPEARLSRPDENPAKPQDWSPAGAHFPLSIFHQWARVHPLHRRQLAPLKECYAPAV